MTRQRRAVLAAAVPLGFLLSGGLVWQASYAAFGATTTNPGNSWQAGSVALSDDKAGTALFSASGLVPGATQTRCIVVSYQGTVASSVHLYGAYADTSFDGDTAVDSALAPYLDVTVDAAPGQFAGCVGFTGSTQLYQGTAQGFVASYASFAGGLDTWTPSSNPTYRTYRFTYALQDDNAAQGRTLGLTLTWEAQSS